MIVLLMGVSGSGKTVVGKLLAKELGWKFYDGDDFHTPENVRKMAGGVPLTDEDRVPWLLRLNELIADIAARKKDAVLACSALKQAYRDILAKGIPDFHVVYLRGDFALIEPRMQERSGHYMKAGLLQSQFETLEEPVGVLTIDVIEKPFMIVARIRLALGLN
jgi:gluconokinase